MNIISENVLDASMEKIEQVIQQAINCLIEHGSKIVDEVKKEYVPLLDDFVKNLKGDIKGVALGKEVDVLDMQALVSFAKNYIVSESNEIVAMKTKQEDGYFIYLAYSKDRKLLPVANNKYLIIKAQALAKEVEDMFAESELIILK